MTVTSSVAGGEQPQILSGRPAFPHKDWLQASLALPKVPELRKQIRAVSWDQAQVTDASLLIVLCGDTRGGPYRPFLHEDVGLAGGAQGLTLSEIRPSGKPAGSRRTTSRQPGKKPKTQSRRKPAGRRKQGRR